jgi:hypothetical protein
LKQWTDAPPRPALAVFLFVLVLLVALMVVAAEATPPPIYPGVTGPAHDPSGSPHDVYSGATIGTAGERNMPGPRGTIATPRRIYWPSVVKLFLWAHRERYGYSLPL